MEITVHTHGVSADGATRWVVGTVDGVDLGAWIEPNGNVILDDYQEWCIDQDLEAAGIAPGSDPAKDLVAAWVSYLQLQGWSFFPEGNFCSGDD